MILKGDHVGQLGTQQVRITQRSPTSVIAYGFGHLHRFWMNSPIRAALVCFGWYLFVIARAHSLGILARHIQATSVPCYTFGVASAPGTATTADGFWVMNWAPLYAVAMPLAAYLMSYFFRVLNNSVDSLDLIIEPVANTNETKQLFTQFLAENFRLQWSLWIFPVSLAAPIILTIIADGKDILAPLQSAGISPSCSRDWSVVGYTLHRASALSYLIFNLCAWAMQLFLGYCGVLVLALSSGVLGTVFRYGIGDQEIIHQFRPPGSSEIPERYAPRWIYCKERCGLERFDTVFLVFVALNLFALVASVISISVNVYGRGGATPGSLVLAIGTMFFIPLSSFWVFVPYFSHFPKKIPEDFQRTPECEDPSPWPFGSEKFSWTVIGITVGIWVFLLITVLRSVFPGFNGK